MSPEGKTDLIQHLIDVGRTEQQQAIRDAVRQHANVAFRDRLSSEIKRTRTILDEILSLTTPYANIH